MSNKSRSLVSVEPEGHCAAIASDALAVLACSLPAGHDEGFRKSRELAVSLCESVAEETGKSVLGQEVLAKLVDALFSSTKWTGWHISFCVAARQGAHLRAFNCGVGGLAWIAANDTIRELLPPNTVGRKLRSEGVTSIPPYVEHVGATVAGRGLLPQDIGSTEIQLAECKTVLAVAEPRIMDSLSELPGADTESDQLRDALDLLRVHEQPDSLIRSLET